MSLGSAWLERILAQESPGGPATRLSVVVPSVVAPGEPFAVKLAALDGVGYASVECEDKARLGEGPWRADARTLVFRRDVPACGAVEGVSLPEEGLFRLRVECLGKTWRSNPVRCTPEPSTRIYWGDPHVHTILSRCNWQHCRSLNFCFVCARHVMGLDWVSAADHVSNGRSDVEKWKVQRVAAELFNDPPRFLTILGYEASLKGGCGGDNNVYFAGDAEAFVDEYEDGNTRSLCEKLAEQSTDFLIVPHHTTRPGKHGQLSDETYLGRRHMPVVEIHSKWGTSEFRGNANPLHEVHPGPSYAQDFLAQGFPLGFIAGTDTHATIPAGFGDDSSHIDRLPGMTAVCAPVLSREAVFENVRARHCYGASGERIHIECEIAGARMGAALDWPDGVAPRHVRATVAGESQPLQVEVIRNGTAVHRVETDNWHAGVDWIDDENVTDVALPPRGAVTRPFVYYYLRATCASGAQGWTSPVWLTL